MTDELLQRYATNVTVDIDDDAVVAAFARVPRHLFLRQIIDPDGSAVPATRDRVYTDEALVTRLRDGLPSSSSSQPSLMAQMLAELRLRPGLRVLEIGAGTGYNAALIATITGVPVVSIDIQPDVVAEARAALDLAGVPNVLVQLGDGFRGRPEHGPYDRIIATVGIGGVPAAWLTQLAPDGLILAPIEHGGLQPCVAVTAGLLGRGVLASGFMLAAGPLHPHADPLGPVTVAEPPPAVAVPAVAAGRYYDLWFWLAAHDRRVTRRSVPGHDGESVRCAVLERAGDATAGLVLVQLDAIRPIGASSQLIEHTRGLVEGWHAAGAPGVAAWRCGFTLTDGLWTPSSWRLA